MDNLISVIIPVYKAEHYLRACLDSVLSSTHRQLEIILVDDGSPDGCGLICDEYAALDSRVVVIHQTNQGLSAARNAGLSKATGEFVGFVDADDIVSPVMYERLLWAMQSTDADIAACEYTRTQESLDSVSAVSVDQLQKITDINDCLSVIVTAPSTRTFTWTYCFVWNKLYRNKSHTKFQVGISPGEDLLFNYYYLQDSTTMVIVPRHMYFYRQTPMSITHTFSARKTICNANVWNFLADNSSKYDPALRQFLLFKGAYESHISSWKIVQEGEELAYNKFLTQARTRITQHFGQLLFYRDTPWKIRAVLLLYRFCYPLWKFAAKHFPQ